MVNRKKTNTNKPERYGDDRDLIHVMAEVHNVADGDFPHQVLAYLIQIDDLEYFKKVYNGYTKHESMVKKIIETEISTSMHHEMLLVLNRLSNMTE